MVTKIKSKILVLLGMLLPKEIDNVFLGPKVAWYAFAVITTVTLWRSIHHLTAHDGGAQSIASIPLDTYSAGAAGTIVGVFALWGLSQLIIGLVYLLACVRYRSLIPFLYLLLVFEYLARYLIGIFREIETAGTAPGGVINLPMVIVCAILLMLCLVPKKPVASTTHKTANTKN